MKLEITTYEWELEFTPNSDALKFWNKARNLFFNIRIIISKRQKF